MLSKQQQDELAERLGVLSSRNRNVILAMWDGTVDAFVARTESTINRKVLIAAREQSPKAVQIVAGSSLMEYARPRIRSLLQSTSDQIRDYRAMVYRTVREAHGMKVTADGMDRAETVVVHGKTLPEWMDAFGRKLEALLQQVVVVAASDGANVQQAVEIARKDVRGKVNQAIGQMLVTLVSPAGAPYSVAVEES